jgi:hypothetical protein
MEVANVALERAHIGIELAAQLARILEPEVDALLVTAQVAFVGGPIAAAVARIRDAQVDPVPVMGQGFAPGEGGAAEVAGGGLAVRRMLAGPVLPQLPAAGRCKITVAAGDVIPVLSFLFYWIDNQVKPIFI